MNKGISKNRFFILTILVVILLSLRLTLLFTTFNRIWHEEGVRLIAAKHILEGTHNQPISDYFQPYEGGSVVVSFLAVPFFWLFGISTISLRLVSLLFSIGILALFFLFLERYFGRKVAALAGLLYIFSPLSYSQYSSYCIGNHHTVLFFDILMVSIFFRIFFAPGKYYNSKKYGYFMLLGLVSGFAGYFCFSSFVFLFCILLFWYIFDKLFFLKKGFLVFIASFILGISPLIYYIISHWSGILRDGWYNPWNYLRLTPLYLDKASILSLLSRISSLFTQELVKSFNFDYYGLYPKRQLWNLYYYFVVLISFGYLIWLNRDSLGKIFKGIIPLKRFDIKPSQIKPEAFFIVFPAVFAISCFLTAYVDKDLWYDRYYFPLYLSLYIFVSLFIIKIFTGRLWSKILSFVIVAGILLASATGNLSIINQRDFWTCDLLNDVISFLRSNNIKYVYTIYAFKWPLVSESKEQIIASSRDIWNCDPSGKVIFNANRVGNRYFEYERMVDSAVSKGLKYAYMFGYGDNFGHLKMINDYLEKNQIEYKKTNIGKVYVIYYDFSVPVKPSDIKFGEKWVERYMVSHSTGGRDDIFNRFQEIKQRYDLRCKGIPFSIQEARKLIEDLQKLKSDMRKSGKGLEIIDFVKELIYDMVFPLNK